MPWKIRSVFVCLLTSIPFIFGNITVYTKLEYENEYTLRQCNDNIFLDEGDILDISFHNDAEIDAIACQNEINKRSFNFTISDPRVEKIKKKLIADSDAFGRWNCSYMIQEVPALANKIQTNGTDYAFQYCSFVIYIKYPSIFTISRNDEVFAAYSGTVNEYFYKNGDTVDIFCSASGIMNSWFSIGSINLRHCFNSTIYKNGTSEFVCQDYGAVSTPEAINNSWTLTKYHDNNLLKCVYRCYEINSEKAVTIELRREPEEPPKMIVNNFLPYETSTPGEYLFDLKVGETAIVLCINPQNEGTLNWVCCDKETCTLCNSSHTIYTTPQWISISTLITENSNGYALECVYTNEFTVLSTKVIFKLTHNNNAVTLNVSTTEYLPGDTIEVTCANIMNGKSEIFIDATDKILSPDRNFKIPTSHLTYNDSYVVDYGSYEMNFTEQSVSVHCIFNRGKEIYEKRILRKPTENPNSMNKYIFSSVGAAVLIALVVIIWRHYRKRKKPLPRTVLVEQRSPLDPIYYTIDTDD